MIKKLSLKFRVILVGVLPLVSFLGVSSYFLNKEYRIYQGVKVLNSQILVIEAASEVVHESQKERGKTAGYLGGGLTLSSLNEQRSINDGKLENLSEIFENSSFPQEIKTEIISSIEGLASLRENVTSREISIGKAIGSYTLFIGKLLDLQLYAAKETNRPVLAAKIKGLRILEDAKESGGKLRANMTGVLATNKGISDKKFSTIVKLKAGVEANINSSGLVLDERSKKFLSDFNSSADWAIVNKTFQMILKNAEKGGYYQDPGKFFAIITKALNILGELVVYQKDQLIAQTQELEDQSLSMLWKTVLGGFFFSGLILVVMVFISSTTTNSILGIVGKLGKSSDELSDSSGSIASTSVELSEAATQQASSLQETVSSIDEISSMVQKNSDAAASSSQVSEKSTAVASRGKEKVEQMIDSIKDISKSNDNIMEEMKTNNEEVSKIISVISQIADKTKVINDIVFQTKLLSFNASVEAARAGEHGKGFAVVAEEVGNLASMSGKAALEISEMLDTSTKQVTDIVDSSKRKIEHLVQTGKEKVELGTRTAIDCGSVIDEIMQNVSSVNEMVREIATASAEQSTGVNEVTKAMQQLDQVTHRNTSVAQDSSEMASTLSRQASDLNRAIGDLTALVEGRASEAKRALSDNVAINNVVNLPQRPEEHNASNVQELKKVSGASSSIPSENDPRFEDL